MLAQFPIHPVSRKQLPLLPRFVDLSGVKDAEQAAQRNHSQSLARLAERGGLTWSELDSLIHDRRLFDMPTFSNGDSDPEYILHEARSAVAVLRAIQKPDKQGP